MAANDFDYKSGAREFVADIEGHAHIALVALKADNVSRFQNETELCRALDRLRPAFDELAARVDDSDGHRALWHLMAAAYTIGSRATLSDIVDQFSQAEKLKRARAAGADKIAPDRAKKFAILMDELAKKPPRPMKIILVSVNERLKDANLGIVKDGRTLRRWKEKLAKAENKLFTDIP